MGTISEFFYGFPPFTCFQLFQNSLCNFLFDGTHTHTCTHAPHARTHAHTGRGIGSGNGCGIGCEAALGASATRGEGASGTGGTTGAASGAASGARRHRGLRRLRRLGVRGHRGRHWGMGGRKIPVRQLFSSPIDDFKMWGSQLVTSVLLLELQRPAIHVSDWHFDRSS